MAKYIFVVGGVMSGVGKGIAASSIGRLLKSRGYSVTALKIDPYVNVDAGTMNPTEHGEVFVLQDGMECDQDLGNYERFLDVDLSCENYMTTGSVYLSVINKERNLEYEGKCVEVVPHIPLEVLDRIDRALAKNGADIAVIEIGGTAGEYQNILFLEAIRMLRVRRAKDVVLALVSYLPIQGGDNELKTKPTQHAVRSLNSAGLQPDIIIARAKTAIDVKRKEKIAFNCSVQEQDVISAPDVKSIYEVPVNFERDGLTDRILSKFELDTGTKDLTEWEALVQNIRQSHAAAPVKIGIVGKYFGTGAFVLADAYISVIEAVKHAAYKIGRKPVIEWLNAEDYDPNQKSDFAKNLAALSEYDGLIVPGGFGLRGVEGKIQTIQYARERKIPYFGLCYGLQLAVVEFSRNVCDLHDAHTTEVAPDTPHPVIHTMADQVKNIAEKNMGGTMRLGAYDCTLTSGTASASAYNTNTISERHRHRYEVNNKYVAKLEEKGMIVAGKNTERDLVEIMEIQNHPFFVGTQFHPELQSRPLHSHPLFLAFVTAASDQKNTRK